MNTNRTRSTRRPIENARGHLELDRILAILGDATTGDVIEVGTTETGTVGIDFRTEDGQIEAELRLTRGNLKRLVEVLIGELK